ncbi:MAG: PBP1A family penicillin-binding protein [Ruminococcaceae bacterium]|nr:PBP1A family penicillin-binding protein [Oscillospiraceae bacterium]
MKRNIIPEKLKVWFSNLRKSKGYKIFKKIMLGTVSAGITMAILLTCSFVFLCYNYTDSDIDIAFENLNLDYTTVIYAKNTQTGKYEAVEELYKDENRIWISLDTLPKYIKDATIAIEDRRFEKHKGVDWWRTGQAVFKYALGDRSGFGGSTLTQQLIKNITGDGARSIERKIKEILRALYIERKYNKDQILEYYLNTVTFGGTCQGIQSAAKRYFNKDATELTLVEAASIIGITNNPSLYDPFLKEENNKNRARTIMYTMLEEGFITQEEYDAAKEELEALTYIKNTDSGSKQSYFVDHVITQVIDDLVKEKGYTKEYATDVVYTKGLKIYTTMDNDVQSVMDAVFTNDANFPPTKNAKGEIPRAAMVIMDQKTGDVLGIVGDRGEKTINRGFNYATQGIRQPGSTMKPIAVFAPAIEKGIINAASIIDDSPSNNDGTWPHNYNGYYSGLMSVRQALLQSNNAVPVRIIQKLGADNSVNFLQNELHLTTLVENDMNPSLALGGISHGATVLEMTAAYQIFPNQGLYNTPRVYTKVESYDGRTLLEKEVDTTQVVSAQTAYSVHQFLFENNLYGTGTPAKLSTTVSAGKTGTTSDDKDRWFIGYTPEYTCGAWFGFKVGERLTSLSVNPCSKLFKLVLDTINTKKGISNTEFAPVPGGMSQITYCLDSGMPVGDACALDPRGLRTETCWVSNESLPTETCTAHHLEYICTASGKLAHSNCPKENLKQIAFVDFERQFSAEVIVGDAQYMLPHLDFSTPLFSDPVWPVYMDRYGEGKFPGKPTGSTTIYNSLCTAHNPANPALLPAQ